MSLPLYIALYLTNDPNRFHWAFVVVPNGDFKVATPVFQIITASAGSTTAVDGWEKSVEWVLIPKSSRCVCCVELPSLTTSIDFDDLENFMEKQPVGQGDTPLLSYYDKWSCSQWSLRTLVALVETSSLKPTAKNSLFMAKNVKHMKWKEMMYDIVVKCGHDAKTKTGGKVVDGVMVMTIE